MLSQDPEEPKAAESSDRYWILQDLNSKKIKVVESRENQIDGEVRRFRQSVAHLMVGDPRDVIVEKFGPFSSKEEVKKEKEILADRHYAVFVDESTGQVESVQVDNLRNFKADILMGKDGRGHLTFEKEFFGDSLEESAKAAEEYTKKREGDFNGTPRRAA